MSRELLRRYIGEVLGGLGNKNVGHDGIGGNLRYDVPIVQRGGNVLDDEENEMQKAKQSSQQAATVLVLRNGKVLGVSRRDDPNDFGLPGGKVDPAEEPIVAAARELEEETGLIASDLKPVFVRQDGDGFVTTTFIGNVQGEIGTNEEGIVKWIDPEELFKGSFGRYNRALFDKLGLK